MEPVRIEGPRIVLRELVESDWSQIQVYAGDIVVVKHEPWGPNTEEQTREFIRNAIRLQQETPRKAVELAVTLKETGELIGTCGIRVLDAGFHEATIGYTLRKDRWGTGLGTEVAQSLIRFGFSQLKLHRIRATCHVENKASARVLEKAGMLFEGILRKNTLQRGEWRDSRLYAVLETD